MYVFLSLPSFNISKEIYILYRNIFSFVSVNYNRRLENLAQIVLFMSGRLLQTVRLYSDEVFQNLVQWYDYLNYICTCLHITEHMMMRARVCMCVRAGVRFSLIKIYVRIYINFQ